MNWPAASFTLAFVALAAQPPSAAIRYDGTVPIYPNGVIEGQARFPERIFKAALRRDIVLFVDTPDAPAAVVGWYPARLPAAFSMHPGSAGTQFWVAKSSQIVDIVRYQGKTRITISPT
jgi:hypothetical protein